MSPNRKFLKYSFKEQLQDMIPALLNSVVVYSVGRVLKLPLILTLIIQIIIGVAVYLSIAVFFKMAALKDVFKILKRD